MEIKFLDMGSYTPFAGIQFARLEKNTDGGFTQIEKVVDCKEVFSNQFWAWKKEDWFHIFLSVRHTVLVGRGESGVYTSGKPFKMAYDAYLNGVASVEGRPTTLTPPLLNAETTQELLNLFEEEMEFPKSTVEIVTNVPETMKPMSCLWIKGSTAWTSTQPLIHLFLILARNGTLHTPGKTWQQTLAKFRRVGTYRAGDQNQFIQINKAVEEIVATKGRLSEMDAPRTDFLPQGGAKYWYGHGIVNYAVIREQQRKAEKNLRLGI